MEKVRIAIADDNKELVKTMVSFFDSHPEVDIIWTAHNGNTCLTMIEDQVPDVLLLDIIMPHLDGIAVLETISGKEHLNNLQVIMLTAFGQEDVMTQAASLGASYFMLKPFEFERLTNQIFQVAGTRKPIVPISQPGEGHAAVGVSQK